MALTVSLASTSSGERGECWGTRSAHPNLGAKVVATCFGSKPEHIAAMTGALGKSRPS
jgi:hypothetical protein